MNRAILNKLLYLLFLGIITFFQEVAFSNESTSRKPTIHCLFTSGMDKDIKEGTEKDINMMRKLLKLLKYSGHHVKVHLLKGKEVTNKNLCLWIEKASVQSDDTIFFYYSGHGVQHFLPDYQSELPILTPGGKTFTLIDPFIDACKRKKPRLTVIMADCCNSPIWSAPLITLSFQMSTKNKSNRQVMGSSLHSSNVKITKSKRKIAHTIQQLFTRTHGTIILAAAKPGYKALGSDIGGLFTLCVVDCIKKVSKKDTTPNWQKLIYKIDRCSKHLKKQTNLPLHPLFITSIRNH